MKEEKSTCPPAATLPAAGKKWLFFPRPVAWLVLVISLTATTGGWFIAQKNAELRSQKRFDEEARSVTAALVERMQVYEDVLHGALGLFAASYSVERGEWRAYLSSVSIESRFPGIDGIGYVARVPRAQTEDFLRMVRRDKTPDFELKNPGTNSDLLVVQYIEPESRHKVSLGLDLGADPSRRSVAERARDTGKATLSGTVTLHDEGRSPRAGFLMLLPVYDHDAPIDRPEQRREAIEGWVFARFVTSELMSVVLTNAAPGLHLRILDTHAAGIDAVVFDTHPHLTQNLQKEALFTTTIPRTIGERGWTLNFATTPEFTVTNRYTSGIWAAGAGSVFSILLFGIVWSLSHTRERALAMASDMTSTLRQTNEQLESEIRERKRSEEALKHSEAIYHSLVESLPLSVARKDLHGRFTFANQRFCSEVDKSLDELVGKTDAEIFAPELARVREQHAREVLQTGATVETVEEHTSEGPPRYVQAIRTPVYNSGDTVIGVLEIFWDITDKHHAEAELEHERFLLRTLMDNVPERIYFKDRDSRFLRNNRAHLRTFGLERPEQAVGKSDFDFFSEEHARQAYDDEQHLMATGEAMTKEERETWPDGSVTWALSTKMPLRDQWGNTIGTFGISRDITDRKRAEHAMRRAKEAAEEANQTKSRFLANMSHELRTPLNSVIGFANILLKNKAGTLSPPELSFLDRILANGKHLLNLINEILDLSKIEARKIELQLTPVGIDTLLRETIAQQEGLVRDRPVRLVGDLPERVTPILTDADKLRQVIINLIGNALKFTEEGTITVRAETDPADHRPVRIDVIDTGIGIPADKLNVIFEAFQQAEEGTARKYGGTGLGLTISQALCRLMGYHIEVASEPGVGSTFSVILGPTAVLAPPSDPGKHRKRKERLGGGRLKDKLVLVIDDESDSRTLLVHAIEELGCQTIAANSGEQGVRMAREFRPHLITVDLMMPNLDGWQVIQTLKADPASRDIPVVVVSIVAGENRGRILGVVEVLQKPVIRSELVATLRRCLTSATPRVLLVDDESDSRRLLANLLEGETCEIRTAGNGREALSILQDFRPDLVLLDLLMPEMDGMTFLNHLRSDPRYRFLPVVIVSAKDLTPEESAQLAHMAEDVVQKGDNLESEMKRVLDRFLRASENFEAVAK